MSLPDGLHADFALDWSDEETLAAAKERQDRICAATSVTAIAYPGEPYVEGEEEASINPGHVAHVYLDAGEDTPGTWAGVVWYDGRLPTTDEIALALTEWRGDGAPLFTVRWWDSAAQDVRATGSVAATCKGADPEDAAAVLPAASGLVTAEPAPDGSGGER